MTFDIKLPATWPAPVEEVALYRVVRGAPPASVEAMQAEFGVQGAADSSAEFGGVSHVRVVHPLRALRTYHWPAPVERAVLDACAAAVVGRHDFHAFTPADTQHDDFVRTVHHCRWHAIGDELRLEIAADAFLRHQVRTLVGTMLELDDAAPLARLLAGASRAEAGATAPPTGLFLSGVRYEGDPDGIELAGFERVDGGPAAIP